MDEGGGRNGEEEENGLGRRLIRHVARGKKEERNPKKNKREATRMELAKCVDADVDDWRNEEQGNKFPNRKPEIDTRPQVASLEEEAGRREEGGGGGEEEVAMRWKESAST